MHMSRSVTCHKILTPAHSWPVMTDPLSPSQTRRVININFQFIICMGFKIKSLQIGSFSVLSQWGSKILYNIIYLKLCSRKWNKTSIFGSDSMMTINWTWTCILQTSLFPVSGLSAPGCLGDNLPTQQLTWHRPGSHQTLASIRLSLSLGPGSPQILRINTVSTERLFNFPELFHLPQHKWGLWTSKI